MQSRLNAIQILTRHSAEIYEKSEIEKREQLSQGEEKSVKMQKIT